MSNLLKYDGLWWSPEYPKHKFAGSLIDDDNNAAKLVLITKNSESIHFYNLESRGYEVLYGRTSNGALITLLECLVFRSSHESNGISKITIMVRYVLDGGLIPQNKIENAFSELIIRWERLQRRFFDSNSNISVEHEKNYTGSFAIKYCPEKPIKFKYSDNLNIEFSFGTDNIPFNKPLDKQIKFKETVWVSLKSNRSESLGFFLKRLDEFIHFFSICTQEYNKPEEVTIISNFDIETKINGEPSYLKVYFPSIKNSQSKHQHTSHVLMPYSVIKDDFPNILKTWGSIAAEILPSRLLYFSSLYVTNEYVEPAFLSLSQAAEVFHRKIDNGTYISSKEYKDKVLPHLKSAIPTTLDNEIKSVYEQKLQFLNEYSLSKRLTVMANKHEDAFKECKINCSKNISNAVNARNHYTHYSKNNENTVAQDGEKLAECEKFLKILIELEMLRVSGVDTMLLHNQMKKLCDNY